MATYKRILLKLSGESLLGESQQSIDANRLNHFANEIKQAVDLKIQIGIVIGGGNIFRGMQGENKGMDRVQGDYMGMLATIINSLALQSALEKLNVKSVLLSGLPIDRVCKPMSSRKAIGLLEKGSVVIMCGGSGNPFFTTDTAAALRAAEIHADVFLKGTRVDGVYSADPEKDPSAKKYDEITFKEAYNKGLHILDMTAFTLCEENHIPLIVFNMNEVGNLKKILSGEKNGTLVKE